MTLISSAEKGTWTLTSVDTWSLVMPVCQFQHFRIPSCLRAFSQTRLEYIIKCIFNCQQLFLFFSIIFLAIQYNVSLTLSFPLDIIIFVGISQYLQLWRNWHTRMIQVHVQLLGWGFDSLQLHFQNNTTCVHKSKSLYQNDISFFSNYFSL